MKQHIESIIISNRDEGRNKLMDIFRKIQRFIYQNSENIEGEGFFVNSILKNLNNYLDSSLCRFCLMFE